MYELKQKFIVENNAGANKQDILLNTAISLHYMFKCPKHALVISFL